MMLVYSTADAVREHGLVSDLEPAWEEELQLE